MNFARNQWLTNQSFRISGIFVLIQNVISNQSYGILLSMTRGLSLSVFILLGQITQNTPEGYNMATFTKIFCIKKILEWAESLSKFTVFFTDNSVTTHLQSFLGLLLATNQSVSWIWLKFPSGWEVVRWRIFTEKEAAEAVNGVYIHTSLQSFSCVIPCKDTETHFMNISHTPNSSSMNRLQSPKILYLFLTWRLISHGLKGNGTDHFVECFRSRWCFSVPLRAFFYPLH